ncbi:bifunctional phosphoribosyl-AMP cyclohydrolase/phosphoribosyl-ATP diphosphatase HisIE [Epilithonimonas ginsengisoli]|uniref:Histidine biosynthesis bifunctional protein HisIE n=1 Tax=Epilithonimonas ginsengisoli TaxID=1245592 RepID=A0ABU4JCW6_9FLAO|nr:MULTISPECIES: bifunctional phosphoribosyl-AMP cyclohydrolase/phosphoribosyl-ATP diphosphatase HisIE [Chryseobacterium group]MBV6878251.1 bifunctional phosphoribosyl-AMP cyclohydrolase/phosphoribosyl-ATP diphosphatase HisIE [Epilithonimonas sp. FP105]MDW8547508.1 bifunctional phosphoribosyl-AMP cyclohydrolase/phosphoribosyl-ATP diphosphatase HisIE [Epilithonimonas ginsengisoli]OAH68905.1 bifunctional phosphoribosyl-AMP cyclohydrolase/phosphoribosyl-ATP diphosphatase [Chryseobacterium sp. FP211
MTIKFDNNTGLVPVIIQDYLNLKVLMLGYMNQESFDKTLAEKKVTFFSRSKNRLWTKGETSGNFLELIDWKIDCDQDAILIKAKPFGPTCHNGTTTCFAEENDKAFLYELQQTISDKIDTNDESSYTNELYKRGINKVAQKVGEEAVELVIEAKDNNTELFLNEAADLMYHYLILLKAKGFTLEDVEQVLKSRSK